jgi:phosphatidylserine/phosphatidylglycerophosphate/cardiolipin synthase-like enzyme
MFKELFKDVYSLKERYMQADSHRFPEMPENRSFHPQFGDPLNGMGQTLLNEVFAMMASNPDQERFKKIVNFLGISLPFCSGRYNKNMEFKCEKQSMGRANDGWLEKRIKQVFRRWQDRWLVVGYNNVFYYEKPEDPPGSMRDNIIFDNDTMLKIEHVGSRHVRALFIISRRDLRISLDGTMNGLICLYYIVRAFLKSNYTKPHRFTSFAPIRDGNDCVFFADGVGYFQEVHKAFEMAKSEIMITDWWMSPEVPLLRPIKDNLENEHSRLDRTLQRAAARGVRVYILVFQELALSLNNDSEHTEQVLESMHPNIKVLRHPNQVVSLWSHHEKIVIVDKRKVFMGGLDLCWGRMDGNNHPLFNDSQKRNFPGVDYYNPLKKDIVKGREYQKSMIDDNYPRMPWHDIAVMLVGKVVNDFVMHFNIYWNHAKETNNEREVLVNKQQGPKPVQDNFEEENSSFWFGGGNQSPKNNNGVVPYQNARGEEMGYVGNADEGYFGNQKNIFARLRGYAGRGSKENEEKNVALRAIYDKQFKETNKEDRVFSAFGAQLDNAYVNDGRDPRTNQFGVLSGKARANQNNPFSSLASNGYGQNNGLDPAFFNALTNALNDAFKHTNNADEAATADWQQWVSSNGNTYFNEENKDDPFRGFGRGTAMEAGLPNPNQGQNSKQGMPQQYSFFKDHYKQGLYDNAASSNSLLT